MRVIPVVDVNVLPSTEQFASEGVSVDDLGRSMEWNGPVLASLDQTVAINAGRGALADGCWSPARIVRGVIDNGRGPDRIKLISLATDVALRAYAGVSADEQLEELKLGLESADLLNTTTSQTADFTSSAATVAELSKATSAKISDKLPGAPLLMVALCHGGLVATLQTALYSAHRHGHDVIVYPVRSSLRKHSDYDIYLADSDEMRHINALAEGRKIVVHDEDASGGTTVQKAIFGLKRVLWRTRPEILGVANLDSRSHKPMREQGEWWEA